ncbi:MAG: EamA family transporter [Nitrospirae bacterium]|nr:EamA family transporter [Nitrospirota bacterium]
MRSRFLIISALAVWSTWGLAVRSLDLPVLVIVFYNALFGLAFQGIALAFTARREPVGMTDGLPGLMLLGFFSLANIITYFFALKLTTVASAVLTHYTAPVFVALIAPFILKDRMGRSTLMALVLSAAGLGLVFTRGLGAMDGDGLLGALAGTLSGLMYAFVIIVSRRVTHRHHPVKVVFVQTLFGAAALSAFVLPGGGLAITPGQGLILAVVGLVHTTLAIVIYMYGIRDVTAQEAGVLGYLEPVLGIVLAFLFLGESPHPLALLGGAMIVFSGFMVVRQGAARPVEALDDYRG